MKWNEDLESGQLKLKFLQLQNVFKEIYSHTTKVNGKGIVIWQSTARMPFT